jgi:hypothetical protein
VNPEQAAVVRRIFEMYALGLGLTKTAKTLNAERIAPVPVKNSICLSRLNFPHHHHR